ncbi:MAG: hypothetical protein IKL10_10165 [Clostridia bacterium]|nr:hypothetical protein [Clostridia bacterium]
MRSCYCPNCGATLKFEDSNRDFGFCQYCGAKIMLDDYRSTHRIVDEAKIKESETKERIRLKELELEAEKRKSAEKSKNFKAKVSIVLGIIGALMVTIGSCIGSLSGNPDSGYYMLSMIGMFPFIAILFIWISGDKEQ